jgi:hypothetical protein
VCAAIFNIKNLKLTFASLSFLKTVTLSLKSINTFVLKMEVQWNFCGIKSEFESILGHPYNKENSEKTVLVHLLVQIIQLKVSFEELRISEN